ncbi:transporter [Adhaeribacter swui]|uniref:Transporter n=1 Tax=Adhaeribacter swui TaxID=2086471 RepID=A0A7G7G2W6_9BACT|nr:transporter [Adhaeribacter swui]QNF31500.1 transporter [Adhaeribacter swui]
MKYNLLVTSFFILISVSAFSQSTTDQPELDSDRPNFTQGAAIVPHKTIQLETGVEFKNDQTLSIQEKTFLYPTTLIRIGILKNAEFRINFDFEKDRQKFKSGSGLLGQDEIVQGFDNVHLGAKIALIKGKGALPDISILGNIMLPVGIKELRPPHAAPEGRLLLNNKLSEKLELQYNVGYRKLMDHEEYQGEMLYSISTNLKVNDILKIFAEYEATKVLRESVDSSLDGGFMFQILPNLQLDVYAGAAVSEAAPDFYTGGGITWRIPR